jgi:hypothetical protein
MVVLPLNPCDLDDSLGELAQIARALVPLVVYVRVNTYLTGTLNVVAIQHAEEIALKGNSSGSQNVIDSAESAFKKRERQAQEGAIAMAEYQASALATAEKTARLRALRLARDAAAAESSPVRKRR